MAAVGKITLDKSEYVRQINEVKSITVDATEQMKNGFKEYGTQVNKAGIATRLISAEMGGQIVGVGRIFQVLASGPVAMVSAALSALVVIGKQVWDSMTQSAEEYRMVLEKNIEIGQKELDSMKNTQSEEDSMMERLLELAKRQEKTNEEKTEAIRLAQILNEKYGDLGTGVIDLADDFGELELKIKAINEAQKQQKIDSLENQIKHLTDLSNDLVTKELKGSLLKQSMDAFSFGMAFLKGDKVQNPQDMIDLYTSSSIQNRLVATSVFRDKNSESSIRFWNEEYDRIRQIIELQNELDRLRDTGFESAKEEASARKKASEESARAEAERLRAEEAAWNEYNQARLRGESEWNREAEVAAQKELDRLDKIAKKREQIRQYFAGRDASLRDAALRATGRGDQADIESALRNFESMKGGKATKDEIARIVANERERMALRGAMSLSASPELYAPRVNSLIARGGSSAPVKMPKVEEYQAKTLNSVDRIAKISDRILNNITDWSTI